MPCLHDFICRKCDIVLMDHYDKPTCPECEGEVEITFAMWTDVAVPNHGQSKNELSDSKGYRRVFNASEDPVCSIELGLVNDHASRGLRTFSPEQSQEYRAKLVRGEDTPALRREILRTRADNEKKAGITTGYTTL